MSTPIDARTLEIQRVLEAAIASHSPHPGLAHFYVHLMELAPEERMVAKAVSQSNLLRSQWPACGHLLHMASHIDMQFGDYERGIRCNWAGIQQDKVYAALRGSNNYYHGYRIHNHVGGFLQSDRPHFAPRRGSHGCRLEAVCRAGQEPGADHEGDRPDEAFHAGSDQSSGYTQTT